MKTRNIILGMLLFAFSACTPENKSVTEPLTPEETEEIDKKYPGFSYNYETYIYPKVNKLSKSSSFYLKLIPYRSYHYVCRLYGFYTKTVTIA